MRFLLYIFAFLYVFQSNAQNDWRDELIEFDSLVIYNELQEAERRVQEALNEDSPHISRKQNKIRKLYFEYNKIFLHDELEFSLIEQLDMLIKLQRKVEEVNEPELAYKLNLLLALTYEKSNNQKLALDHLDVAYKIYERNNLHRFYSSYCVRKSSVMRFINDIDSSEYFAIQALIYAKKYKNQKDYFDAHILLKSVAWLKGEVRLAINYSKELLNMSKDFGSSKKLFTNYNSLSDFYREIDLDTAILYNDSSYVFYESIPPTYQHNYERVRYMNFEKMGNIDSAYFYIQFYYKGLIEHMQEDQNVRALEIDKKFKNEQIKSSLKIRNQWLFVLLGFSALIITGLIVLARKKTRIIKQNEIISTKNADLEILVGQKQVLLAELQHRVKNNLQQVVSILDFQREQKEFHNPEELIRSTQNRVYSMAFLHKKLHVFEDVNTVEMSTYLTELAQAVKKTYNNAQTNIDLRVSVEELLFPINTAMPIGLILVELISNSMKHAFKTTSTGFIELNMSQNQDLIKLCYRDSGPGYDVYQKSKAGLGGDIVLGLIDQLDAKLETKRSPIFEICFTFRM